MHILREGDRGEALCSACRTRVPVRYEYRTMHLEKSNVDVENVLVGVCESCEDVLTVPAQSTPRLKEVRDKTREPHNFRVPRHLDDVLVLIADQLEGSPKSFPPVLLRYYLRELGSNEGFARRVQALTKSELARGKADARLSFRMSQDVLDRAWERARSVGIRNRSTMLKALIVAAKEDVLDSRAKARRRALAALAPTV